MRWDKITHIDNKGELVQAIAPLIISASRASDIPAFRSEWFFQRLREGYSEWRNPFNGVRQYVSYSRARVIYFWSKNPAPLLPYLPSLKERDINACLHFTLNNYSEADRLEPGLPPLGARIDTFRRMADAMGRGHVIWRFDPLILAGTLTADVLLERIEGIAACLSGYAERLVFSFADIACYRRVESRMRRRGIAWREFTGEEVNRIAEGVARIARQHNMTAATCAEAVDLSAYGIEHNRCIDGALLARLFPRDRELAAFLNAHGRKDSGQRPHCGCIPSKDIGEYGTCAYGCLYCYANA